MTDEALKACEPSSGLQLDRRTIGVIVRFAIYFAVFDAAVFWLLGHTGSFIWLQDLTARVAAGLTAWSGVAASAVGSSIFLPNRTLFIGADCTGIFLAGMLAALVLAYPVKWRMRLLGVLGGVALLLLANFARLVAVAHLSVAAPSLFQVAHDFLFQVGMVLVVAAIWMGWLAAARRHAR